jgi:HPt (histidine-containing phosphotransfer) domain-containing protein
MITADVDVQPRSTDSIDLSVLASFDDPDMGGEPDLVIELIDLYQDEAARLVEVIRTGLQNSDWTSVKRAAHSLRGSSSNLGILQIALISDDLEHKQFADVAAAEPLFQSLEQELTRVNVILEQERKRRSA